MCTLQRLSKRARLAIGIALIALAIGMFAARRLWIRRDARPQIGDNPPILGGVVLTVLVIALTAGIAFLRHVRPGVAGERVVDALLVALGLIAVAAYYVASRHTTIGAPTDIGGGLILVFGYGALGTGVFRAVSCCG
jgi:hypothetical protein